MTPVKLLVATREMETIRQRMAWPTVRLVMRSTDAKEMLGTCGQPGLAWVIPGSLT